MSEAAVISSGLISSGRSPSRRASIQSGRSSGRVAAGASSRKAMIRSSASVMGVPSGTGRGPVSAGMSGVLVPSDGSAGFPSTRPAGRRPGRRPIGQPKTTAAPALAKGEPAMREL